ncbi:type VI secretion system contractile sheath domain-containing protein [Maridesulfovibrio sp. FT414]|uniref:type VI secretion system contractile sheath domain-containing protein n=1 Tax=Maridesulfovibrio sp. FT414 TaxID=2979469 RepID=UPI003D808634
MQIDLPPFIILALAPFSPALETPKPPLIKTDTLSIDQALGEIRPAIDIPVDRDICPDGSISVSINRMADFRPRKIEKNCAFIKTVTEARNFLRKNSSEASFRAQFPELAGLVNFPPPTVSAARSSESEVLDDLFSMVDTGGADQPATSSSGADTQLERLHSALLEAVFSSPLFRQLESAWRGLELLCRQVPSGSKATVELWLVPVSQGNLPAVLEKLENDLAESPPDLILLDRALSNSARSMEELELTMNFAESMLAPTLIQIGPQFLELPNWSEIKKLPFIPSLLEGAEYGRWKTLREKPSAGWIMLCVGSVMGRTMLSSETGYEITSLTEKGPLWTGTVWGMAALCGRSLAIHGRPTCFANHSEIRLEGLPIAEGPVPSPVNPPLGTERIKDFRLAGINAPAFNGDQIFTLHSTSMDGGPFNLRLYLSRLIHFLIQLSTSRRAEFMELETDLTQAVSLFLQRQGYPAPHDLEIKAKPQYEGTIPLEISLTPGPEILPGNAPFSFGFNW